MGCKSSKETSPKRLLVQSFTCNDIKTGLGLGVVRIFKVGKCDVDCGKVSVIGGEIEEDKLFEVLQNVEIVELTCEQLPTTIQTDGPKREIVETLTFNVYLGGTSGIKAVGKIVSKFDVLNELKINLHGNVSIRGEVVSIDSLSKCMEKVKKYVNTLEYRFGDGSLNGHQDENFNV